MSLPCRILLTDVGWLEMLLGSLLNGLLPFPIGTYIDKKCPFTGDVSIRGRILAGTCHSAKMMRTIIVRRNYLHYVKKYQRWESCLPCMVPIELSISLWINTDVFSLQVWEKAFKYSSSYISLLPCQRRRPCHHWTVQVRLIFIVFLSWSCKFTFLLTVWF